MSRFASPQDPLFQRPNSSVSFDYRLAPSDLELSYTHLQRAQPVSISHHLLAYFWKFRRDLERFDFCMSATDAMPLGAGALAGVNFLTDRVAVARELGFGRVAENSMDAVSNRDFVL